MATHLEEILASTRRDLALRRQSADFAALEKRAAAHTPRGLAAALRRHSAAQPAIIAELKKASPSRGLIRADFPVASLAAGFASAGAAALSVLTEEHFFQGSLTNLQQASQAVTIPCLRKDFIVDEFQILEARAASADAVLLIAAALDHAALQQLTRAAHARQLDVLCEVHDAEELARVLDLGCDAIGVNNRNLCTFEVRLETSLELAPGLPSNAVRVAESGIHTAADIARLRAAGFDAFLVGESLMRHADPAQALTNLLSASAPQTEVPA
jgi:indole-3-glycerol phosphate synthase